MRPGVAFFVDEIAGAVVGEAVGVDGASSGADEWVGGVWGERARYGFRGCGPNAVDESAGGFVCGGVVHEESTIGLVTGLAYSFP